MSRYLCNKIRCPVCEEVIQSYHRHDFKFCKCESVAVDGGADYLRRVSDGKWEELSVIDDENHETRRNNLVWGVNYTKEMVRLEVTEWRLIKDLNTEHINAILDGEYCKDPFYLEVFNNELEYRKTL